MTPLNELTPYQEDLPKNIIHKWMFGKYVREILREPIPIPSPSSSSAKETDE